jgi:hypothetical protein
MPKIGSNITDSEDATRLWRIYESVSKNIERENTLIGLRIAWAIFLSAGIVGVETLIANFAKDYYGSAKNALLAAHLASMALTILAIFFCYSSRKGVLAAQAQMAEVKAAYEAHETDLKSLGYPRPYGDALNHHLGNYNANVFPTALLILWSVFLLLQAVRLYMMVSITVI